MDYFAAAIGTAAVYVDTVLFVALMVVVTDYFQPMSFACSQPYDYLANSADQ